MALILHLTENWALNVFRKLAYLQLLVGQFRDKQKFHSAPKQSPYRSLEQLTVYNVIKINSLICLTIYFLKHRAQQLLVWKMHLPKLGNLPIIGDFSLLFKKLLVTFRYLGAYRIKLMCWHEPTVLVFWANSNVFARTHIREERALFYNQANLS